MSHGRESERFTDDDLAFLRHARFGELPPRVRPDQFVETVETEPGRDVPGLDPQPYNVVRGSVG